MVLGDLTTREFLNPILRRETHKIRVKAVSFIVEFLLSSLEADSKSSESVLSKRFLTMPGCSSVQANPMPYLPEFNNLPENQIAFGMQCDLNTYGI